MGLALSNATVFICSAISLFGALIFYGLAEFFQQIARIATATEETARLLRDIKPSQ